MLEVVAPKGKNLTHFSMVYLTSSPCETGLTLDSSHDAVLDFRLHFY